MSEWKRYRIFELAHLNKNSIDRSYPFTHIEYLDTSSIVCGSISGYQVIPLKEAPSRAKRIVKQNSIVYSTVRPIQRHYGLLKSPKPHTVVSTGFTVIDANTTLVDPYFLYYWLTSDEIVEYLEKLASSSTSTYPSIRPDDIGDLIVDLPPINEQKAIAEILSSLDDKIELNNQTNANLEALAQAIFKQWFIDFEFPDENGNPYKSSGGKMVDSSQGLIPDGWQIKKLKEILNIKRGGSPRPIQDYIAPTGLPWVKISDATAINTPFIFRTKEFIKPEGLKKTVLLKKGSLILSNSATPGLPKFLELDACIHDGWLHFQDMTDVSYQFLYLLFVSIRKDLVGKGNGSIFINLKTDILKEYSISVPSPVVISAFNAVVKPIFEQIKALAIEANQLANLRDLILPKMLSGQISVA